MNFIKNNIRERNCLVNTEVTTLLSLVGLINKGTIKIGDYIAYQPDSAKETDKAYIDLVEEMKEINITEVITQENLGWRLLEIKNGNARIISDVPTTQSQKIEGFMRI